MTVNRIRGRKLQRIRANHFRHHPLCVTCLAKGRTTPATELDHKTPIYKGGQDTDANRQGLCTDCHKAKTATDMGYDTNKGSDLNGIPLDPAHHWNR